MKLIKDIYNFLFEQSRIPAILKSKKNRPGSLANAIKQRNPVSFFYNGPRKQVQAGRRVKAEIVALGVSKKGKMIVRAWVEPPSRSKTGFGKGNWRTFIVARMNQVEIFDDETFNVKRPGYKEGDDGSMLTTYVTSNWSSIPKVEPKEPESQPTQTDTEPTVSREPSVEPIDRDTEEPSVEPQSDELPQPEPENRPSIEPPKIDDEESQDDEEDENDEDDNNYDGLNENIERIKTLLYN
jgi:hypothetical protein